MTIQQLHNWIKCNLITDAEIINLPAEFVKELSRPLRERWTNLNKEYYNKGIKYHD